ncbi:MAG: zinc ribbon domain-containing protein [Deltaproteobacteria bacterium]|nr:zinc ribbon domain-containing protein [Deltaproteobacteria bacterium]
MPIFEYICGDCGVKFEELVRNSGDTVECPSCHGRNNEKTLSTFAFKSEGGGFSPSGGSACAGCKPASPSACSGCGK